MTRTAEACASVHTLNFSRALPFPFGNLFDPVAMLMLLVNGLVIGRRIKPTHVAASMPPLETGTSAWLIAKVFNAHFVIDLRDDWESAIAANLVHYFPRALLKIPYKVANRLYSTAVAMMIATQAIGSNLRKKGVGTPLIFAPNGADTAMFYPKPERTKSQIRARFSLPRDKLLVIYSGSGINPYYRLDLILASMKKILKQSAEELFFVFYLYNGHTKLNKLQKHLKIPTTQLEIRRPLPREQLAKVTSACDVGLVPFDDKPYLLCARSTKIYEYLSCGLYTVSSGPKGGELDAFFSHHPELGLFTCPTASDYARVLTSLIDQKKSLLDERSRKIRYEFIRMNYDRQTMMRNAVDLLFVAGQK